MTGERAAEAFRAFEAGAWERLPERYDDFWTPVTGRAIEPVLDAARAGQGTRVLDVASGPGHLAGAAAARGARVTAVDLAASMARAAARRYPDVEFRVGAAEALPFGDHAFDATVSAFGLGHFAEPEAVVREMARVTRHGGRVVVAWWAPPAEARLLGVFHDALEEVGAPPPEGLPPGPPFFRNSDDETLRPLLEEAGLADVVVEHLAFVHPVPSADALWDGVLASTARTSAAILGQPEAIRQRIRAVFDRKVAPYAGADGLAMPVAIRIAAGTA